MGPPKKDNVEREQDLTLYAESLGVNVENVKARELKDQKKWIFEWTYNGKRKDSTDKVHEYLSSKHTENRMNMRLLFVELSWSHSKTSYRTIYNT